MSSISLGFSFVYMVILEILDIQNIKLGRLRILFISSGECCFLVLEDNYLVGLQNQPQLRSSLLSRYSQSLCNTCVVQRQIDRIWGSPLWISLLGFSLSLPQEVTVSLDSAV